MFTVALFQVEPAACRSETSAVDLAACRTGASAHILLHIRIKNTVASKKFLISQIDLSFQGIQMSLDGTTCRDIAGPFMLLPVLLTNTAEEMLKNVGQFILTNGFKVANNGRRHTEVLENCDPIAGCISCWHSIPQQLITVFLRGIPQ